MLKARFETALGEIEYNNILNIQPVKNTNLWSVCFDNYDTLEVDGKIIEICSEEYY